MRVGASHGGDSATSEGVATRPRTDTLRIPIAEINGVESIATGFKQDMFQLSDDEGEVGSCSTTAGWGADFIHLTWGDKTAIIRGVDLLRAWVRTFDPDGAKRIPDGLARRRPAR